MLATLKEFGPITFYIIALGFFLLSVTGRPKWSLLLTIGLAPLRNVVERLDIFPMGKDLLDVLIFGLLVGWILTSLLRRDKLFTRCAVNPIAITLILYSLFTVIMGSLYLKNPLLFDVTDDRIQDWKNFILLPVLFFLTFNLIEDRKWIKRVLWVMAGSMILMNCYTTTQISWFTNLASREKIVSTFVYLGPNEVAAFYNQYTIILLGIYFCMRKSLIKLLLLGLIATNIFCVLFLFSRGAYLGLLGGMVLLAFFKKRILIVPLILFGIFWQAVLPQKVIERIEMTTDVYGHLESSAADRLVIWGETMDVITKQPVFGLGFGVFRHLGFILKDTHNIYLKILVEQGVFGLFIFLILIIVFFREGWSLYRQGNDDLSRGLGLGFAIAIGVLLVNNLFGDRWTYWEISAFMWAFAGLVCRYRVIVQEEAKYRKTVSAPQKPFKSKRKVFPDEPLLGYSN